MNINTCNRIKNALIVARYLNFLYRCAQNGHANMKTNDHQLRDYSAVLNQKYGAPGTKEREQFDEEAWNFYTSQLCSSPSFD